MSEATINIMLAGDVFLLAGALIAWLLS